jgi:hypothetical protein
MVDIYQEVIIRILWSALKSLKEIQDKIPPVDQYIALFDQKSWIMFGL